MAQKGKIRVVVQDSATGNALSGVTVVVRKQGATVNGDHAGAQTSFTVSDPGSITAADEVAVNTGTTSVGVDSTTATNVTVSVGFTDVDDDDRLTVTNNLPTLYYDANGDESEDQSTPLTTDSNGVVEVWADVVPYDIHISGGTATTTLITDFVPEGNEALVSHVHGDSGSAVGFIMDTSRALDASDKLVSVRENTTERFYIEQDGTVVIVAGGLTITAGGATITAGGLTMAGDLTMSDTASQIIPGATSFAVRDNADSNDNLLVSDAGVVTARAGLVTTAGGVTAVAAQSDFYRIGATGGTLVVTGDFSLSAGWGTTASVTSVRTGSRDTRGGIVIQSAGTGQTANPTVTFTYKDGTYTTTPFVIVCPLGNYTVPTTGDFWYVTPSAASCSFIFGGTPVATRNYGLLYMILK
jgi:hypothetical protein